MNVTNPFDKIPSYKISQSFSEFAATLMVLVLVLFVNSPQSHNDLTVENLYPQLLE